LGDSSGGSAQAAVIMKSQVNMRMEIHRKIATRVRKFVDNFAGHRFVFWSDSRL